MNTTKFCRGCDTTKPVSDFYASKTKPDGLQTQCRECRKAYNRLHYRRHSETYKANARKNTGVKRDFWREFKSQLVCSECGEDHPATIEFHHLDPSEKDFNLSNAMNSGYSEDRIRKEMKKCIILCSNCHRTLHWNLNRDTLINTGLA